MWKHLQQHGATLPELCLEVATTAACKLELGEVSRRVVFEFTESLALNIVGCLEEIFVK